MNWSILCLFKNYLHLVGPVMPKKVLKYSMLTMVQDHAYAHTVDAFTSTHTWRLIALTCRHHVHDDLLSSSYWGAEFKKTIKKSVFQRMMVAWPHHLYMVIETSVRSLSVSIPFVRSYAFLVLFSSVAWLYPCIKCPIAASHPYLHKWRVQLLRAFGGSWIYGKG